jgi:LemA protein
VSAVVFVWIIVAVVVLVCLLGIWAFNGLVRRRNRTAEAWSQIDIELKRRHDLIPNLVQTVKGYAAHESSTFEAVTQARAAAVSAGATADPARIAAAENSLSTTLRSLFAVAEYYPTLRAVESFLALQEQLTATEDKLEYARRYYNTSARDYNTAIQTFPRTVIASRFGFSPVTFFGADASERDTPVVDFSAARAPARHLRDTRCMRRSPETSAAQSATSVRSSSCGSVSEHSSDGLSPRAPRHGPARPRR